MVYSFYSFYLFYTTFYVSIFRPLSDDEVKERIRLRNLFRPGNCPGRPATTCDWEKEVMNCNCPDKKCYCVRK